LIIVPENALKYKESEKKILKTMTVQKLKGLLQRMFKIPSVPIKITVVSSQVSVTMAVLGIAKLVTELFSFTQDPGITFTLENDFIELGQYSIEDGDTLRIHW